ncbi:MAG: SDR family NAD(P)-dependent oxidoreductase, partial [Calditrichaeota bacterium]|nr:SDR family NAD(P)-dependent oxidoreductase [Calditrichota bacterium]
MVIVKHLLALGHHVGTFARRCSASISELERGYDQRLDFAELDARDTSAVAAYVSAFKVRHGQINGLVNNAAIGQDSLLVHTSPETIGDI